MIICLMAMVVVQLGLAFLAGRVEDEKNHQVFYYMAPACALIYPEVRIIGLLNSEVELLFMVCVICLIVDSAFMSFWWYWLVKIVKSLQGTRNRGGFLIRRGGV